MKTEKAINLKREIAFLGKKVAKSEKDLAAINKEIKKLKELKEKRRIKTQEIEGIKGIIASKQNQLRCLKCKYSFRRLIKDSKLVKFLDLVEASFELTVSETKILAFRGWPDTDKYDELSERELDNLFEESMDQTHDPFDAHTYSKYVHRANLKVCLSDPTKSKFMINFEVPIDRKYDYSTGILCLKPDTVFDMSCKVIFNDKELIPEALEIWESIEEFKEEVVNEPWGKIMDYIVDQVRKYNREFTKDFINRGVARFLDELEECMREYYFLETY